MTNKEISYKPVDVSAIDIVAIEREARRLRALAFANMFRALMARFRKERQEETPSVPSQA